MSNIINRYATYTIVFNNLLELEPDFIWEDLVLDTDEQTNRFKEMFIARWGLYEIGGETVPQFKDFVRHTFNTYYHYYLEKINAYDTEIDMLDGVVDTVLEEDNSQYIDLPNKQTSKEYISNKNKSNRQITRKGGVNVIDLKRNYLRLIQDVYKEFVDKFENCFIQIFS